MPTSRRNRGRIRLVLKESTGDANTQYERARRRRHRSEKKRPKQAASLSFQELQDLVSSAVLTYEGWESDVAAFHKLHAKYYRNNQGENMHDQRIQPELQVSQQIVGEWVLASHLEGMKNKQAASEGDRSHPHLRALDSLVPHLTYPNWPVDYQAALHCHYQTLQSSTDAKANTSTSNTDWNRKRSIFRLQQKQCVHQGDRSHPRLVELDSLLQRLYYPGYHRDWEACEDLHFQYSDDYVGNQIVAVHMQSMRHRQKHWDNGGTSVKQNTQTARNELDTLRQTVSYDGCQEDIQVAQEAYLYPCSSPTLDGKEDGSSRRHILDYRAAMLILQNKQTINELGDRSHPRLQQLDRELQQITSVDNSQQSSVQELRQQLEDVHVRYATDDWVGNAIFDTLLRVLKKQRKQSAKLKLTAKPLFPTYEHGGKTVSIFRSPDEEKEDIETEQANTLAMTAQSPARNVVSIKKVPPTSPSSIVTDATALNTTLSWDSSDNEEEEEESGKMVLANSGNHDLEDDYHDVIMEYLRTQTNLTGE